MIHIIPGGPFKQVGTQAFPPDDPRLFTAIGDNITHLNFFAIRQELISRMERAVRIWTARANYGDRQGFWIQVTEKDLGIPKRPTVMRVLLDENSHLPLLMEYVGYDDPEGFLSVRFDETVLNAGVGEQ